MSTGLLSEHEGVNKSQAPVESYNEPTEEKQARKLAERLYKEAKTHRKAYDENWLRNYKMFRGKQWEERRPSYRHSEVINLVFKSIQSIVPQMTDARPKFSFLPQEPSDLELAQILDELCDADWAKYGWLYKLTETIYESKFYGHGIGYMGYDHDADGGAGAPEMCASDPFYFFPDPNAEDVNGKKTRYAVYAEPVDLDVLKAQYPQKAQYMRSDLDDLAYEDKTSLEEIKYRAPNRDKIYVETEERMDRTKRELGLKLICYIKSGEMIEQVVERIDETGAKVQQYEQRLKYPNGRMIVVAGGVVVEDRGLPFADGLIPYARLTNYILPREFYGISDVEQTRSPQIMFNKIVSFAMDTLTIMGNPIWIADNDSGVDTDALVNRPGLVVTKNKGSEVRREEGVHLQPYVFQLIDRLKVAFDDMSGDTDVSRGISSEGVTAASAIQALQEASRTRIRQNSRNLDQFLQELGMMYKNRVFEFYTSPRVFRITNIDGSEKYFKFHVEKREDGKGGQQTVATIRPFIKDEITGRYHESLEAKELIKRGDFDVRVTTGSSLPFAKKEKADLALQLFDRGIVDAEEVLEATDYPNKEKVLVRMQQAKDSALPPEAQAPTAQGA